MKHFKFDPGLPIPASELRTGKLTADLADAISRATMPTKEEVASWLRAIRKRKNWSRAYVGAVLRIQPITVGDYEELREEPPNAIKFLIWLYMMMDAAPAVAFDLQHQVSWGKCTPSVANTYVKLAPEIRAKILAELKTVANSKYTAYPYKMTLYDISKRHNISKEMAKVLATEAGYKPKKGKSKYYKLHRPKPSLSPHSIWMHLDWRKKNRELAREVGKSEPLIRAARLRFRKIPKLTLCRHIGNCGVDRKHFHPFIGPEAKPFKGRKPYQKRNILFPVDSHPKIISSSHATINEDIEAQRTAEPETTAGSGREQSDQAAQKEKSQQVRREPDGPEPGLRQPERTSWRQANHHFERVGGTPPKTESVNEKKNL